MSLCLSFAGIFITVVTPLFRKYTYLRYNIAQSNVQIYTTIAVNIPEDWLILRN